MNCRNARLTMRWSRSEKCPSLCKRKSKDRAVFPGGSSLVSGGAESGRQRSKLEDAINDSIETGRETLKR